MNIYTAEQIIDNYDLNPLQLLIYTSDLTESEKTAAAKEWNIVPMQPEVLKAFNVNAKSYDLLSGLAADLKNITPVLYPSNHIQYKVYKAIKKAGYRVLENTSYSIKLAANIYIKYALNKKWILYVNGYKYE